MAQVIIFPARAASERRPDRGLKGDVTCDVKCRAIMPTKDYLKRIFTGAVEPLQKNMSLDLLRTRPETMSRMIEEAADAMIAPLNFSASAKALIRSAGIGYLQVAAVTALHHKGAPYSDSDLARFLNNDIANAAVRAAIFAHDLQQKILSGEPAGSSAPAVLTP